MFRVGELKLNEIKQVRFTRFQPIQFFIDKETIKAGKNYVFTMNYMGWAGIRYDMEWCFGKKDYVTGQNTRREMPEMKEYLMNYVAEAKKLLKLSPLELKEKQKELR